MRNRLKYKAIQHGVMATSIAASLIGCSLFVSLDDLDDGNKNADAALDADASPSIDATWIDTGATDANPDADSGVYFVADICVADPTDVVNLTTAGSIDWVHYGTSSDSDQKNVSTHAIGALLQSADGQISYSGDPRVLSWSDGTSFPSAMNVSTGQYDSTGPMVISVDADPSRRVLTLYLGAYSVTADVTIAMSPGPASYSQALQTAANDDAIVRCVVHFASPVAAQITMTYKIDQHLDAGADYGNIAFMAATVAAE